MHPFVSWVQFFFYWCSSSFDNIRERLCSVFRLQYRNLISICGQFIRSVSESNEFSKILKLENKRNGTGGDGYCLPNKVDVDHPTVKDEKHLGNIIRTVNASINAIPQINLARCQTWIEMIICCYIRAKYDVLLTWHISVI